MKNKLIEAAIFIKNWCATNSKYTYYGKILGKKVQKTIRVCICCSAMRSDEDIREEVAEIFGWDYNEEDD